MDIYLKLACTYLVSLSARLHDNLTRCLIRNAQFVPDHLLVKNYIFLSRNPRVDSPISQLLRPKLDLQLCICIRNVSVEILFRV